MPASMLECGIGGHSLRRQLSRYSSPPGQLLFCQSSLQSVDLEAVNMAQEEVKALPEVSTMQIKKDGITRLVVLPLYPHFSISTSASSLRLFEAMLQRDPELQVWYMPLKIKGLSLRCMQVAGIAYACFTHKVAYL